MLTLLNTNQQNATEKMLKEMEGDHTPTEDIIHNWLCDQEDEELFKGILKDDRSIKGSVQFCASKASEFKNGNCAMVDDATVFGWVRDYFILDKVDVKPVAAKVSTAKSVQPAAAAPKPKKKKTAKKEVNEGLQIDLFDSL